MGYDRLTCLMAACQDMKDREGRYYGPHYGRLVADTTPAQREALVERGRRKLERRDAVRLAARGRKEKQKGEGQWKSDPARRKN